MKKMRANFLLDARKNLKTSFENRGIAASTHNKLYDKFMDSICSVLSDNGKPNITDNEADEIHFIAQNYGRR